MLKRNGTNMCDRYSIKSNRRRCKIVDIAVFDVTHRLHCLVLSDTYLYNLTKGKTYRVNQRWRHTTFLQHPCYDVGCYPFA